MPKRLVPIRKRSPLVGANRCLVGWHEWREGRCLRCAAVRCATPLATRPALCAHARPCPRHPRG